MLDKEKNMIGSNFVIKKFRLYFYDKFHRDEIRTDVKI
jgi:hypothetical protein